MEQQTEIMYRRVWEKVRENNKITCQTAMFNLRRHLSIHLCFFIYEHTIDWMFFHFSQCIWCQFEALEVHICLNSYEQQFRELLNYYEDTFIIRHNRTRSLSAIIFHSIMESIRKT
ncbi:hypothetical protein HZS_1627 [Henneguya salminicola]|nr:hypothetical protein HZS_1627 [Henneguya salminicola]